MPVDDTEFQRLIAELGRHDSWKRREAAAQALGQLVDSRAVEPLLATLGDGDAHVRRASAEALTRLGETELVEETLGALDGNRKAARRLLARGDARTIGPLSAVLKGRDETLGAEAAKALGLLGDARAVEALIAALKDRDSGVRWCAAEALGRLGDRRAVEPLIAALEDAGQTDSGRAPAEALGRLGDARAVEPLIAALGYSFWTVRRVIAKALGELGDARAVESLTAALQDPGRDFDFGAEAADALGQIRDPSAIKPLIAALKVERWTRSAARALMKLGERRLGGAVLDALGGDPASAVALSAAGDTRAIPALIAALAYYQPPQDEPYATLSDFPAEHKAALKALVSIGPPAVEFLVAALQDRDETVRRSAADVLVRIGDPRAAEPLIVALQSGDEAARRHAAEVLCQIGAARAVEPLIVALRQPGVPTGKVAKALGQIGDIRAVEPLIGVLQHAYYGEEAAEALGRIGDPRAVEPLVAALGDRDEKARSAAAEALGRFGEQRLAEAVGAALRGDPTGVLGLSAAGDTRAVGPLIRALAAQEWRARRGAAEALGQLRDARAVDRLVEALRDGNESVRGAAGQALALLRTTLRPQARTLLCRGCLTRFEERTLRYEVEQGKRLRLPMPVCRSCGKAGQTAFRVSEVVAVLDRAMSDDEFAEGVARGNAVRRNALFDFDRVEIVDATDEEVEYFCREVHSDAGWWRKRRYRRMAVAIAPACELGLSALQALRSVFGKVGAGT